MTNKSEIFSQWISAMNECSKYGLYDDVTTIGSSIPDDILAHGLSNDDCDDSIIEYVRLMAFNYWRSSQVQSNIDNLVSSLESFMFYDEELFEEDCYLKAFIIREKSKAMIFLSDQESISEGQRKLYEKRGMEGIDRALEMFKNQLDDKDAPECYREDYLKTLLDKGRYIGFNDLAAGRNFFIETLPLFDIDYLAKYARGLYDSYTDRLFQKYYPKWLQGLNEAHISSREVHEDIFTLLLKNNYSSIEEFSNGGFTNMVKPEDRNSILIVENILDAVGVDFDKIQQVFTKDMIPHDIRFEGELPPIPGMVYVPKKNNSPVYVPSYQYNLRGQLT